MILTGVYSISLPSYVNAVTEPLNDSILPITWEKRVLECHAERNVPRLRRGR